MPVSRKSTLVPYWTSECGRAVVYVGDCLSVMEQMDPRQFHAIATDPPYNLSFMGRDWDSFKTGRKFQAWFFDRAEAMLRVARPGAHLLSFGGTRMWHRMACAVEDAGWEIRDTIMWVYSQGFPKSHDVSKAIDKVLGAERDKVKKRPRPETSGTFCGSMDTRPWIEESRKVGYHEVDGSEPVTDAARQWDGWGTALKPAYEPVVLARRPLRGSVAECVLEEGCGGINISGCRVGTEDRVNEPGSTNPRVAMGDGWREDAQPKPCTGRWPANVIYDGSDEVVDLLPEVGSGSGPSARPRSGSKGYSGGLDQEDAGVAVTYGDKGSAARFFYSAKANADDRPHGKEAIAHVTVKPLDLMRYLVRLVCVLGGTVLDPFMGSGSTGCAAVAEGMCFVGIEQSQEYADLAVGRLRLALQTAPVHVWEPLGWAAKSEVDVPPPPRRLRS